MSERVFSDCGLNATSKRSQLGADRLEHLTIISKNSDKFDNLVASGSVDLKILEAMGAVENAFKSVTTFTEPRDPEEYNLEDEEVSAMFSSNTLEDMIYNSSDDEESD